MRFLLLTFLFLVVSCSTKKEQLNYHYSSTKRLLANEAVEVQVERIEMHLKDEVLFASGMDSTFIIVRLFDKEGNLLTTVDPSDITLSTDVDVKAKPFTFKQGVYKAEILPKVKSGSITMRVDWQDTILSNDVMLVTTVKPRRNELIPVDHEYFENKGFGEINLSRGSSTADHATDGFNFDNVGNNRIVYTESASRSFSFEYVEHARQNLLVQVQDSVEGNETESMNSLFMFFPRKQLPIVEQLSGTLNVTLANGEKVIFQKESKEIVDGVLMESPLSLSAFPDLKYRGQGVILKANARGQPPQISSEESADVVIINGVSGQRCKRPKTDFWEPIEVSPIEFRFASDEDFDEYLKKNCGFSLPKI
ncbi:MAG TPA: hypothetical protein VNJ08_00890 [Bacteriovoracaceae bacterium]|nr:hypothetical protein [Bacteriovoracaceae bacterium]